MTWKQTTRAAMAAAVCMLLVAHGATAASGPVQVTDAAARGAASNDAGEKPPAATLAESDATALLEAMYPLADSPDSGQKLIGDIFKLIRDLQHVQDLTREHVEQRLGITFIARRDADVSLPDYMWNRRLTKEWWMVGVDLRKGGDSKRPRLSLTFLNIKNSSSAMTPICANLYEFAPAMVSSYGYEGRPIGDDVSHIRYLEYFRKGAADSPVVELYPANERPDGPEQGKTCLRSIVIF